MKRSTVVGVAVLALIAVTGCSRKTKTGATAATSGLQRIHFDFDQSTIRSEYEPVLRNNAAWLQANSKKNVVIEGHCDERGSNEYNIALGDRRANASKNYLQKLGVTSDRMSTVSYGEERPLKACSDESCWSQNRRAEFVAKSK